MRSVRKRCPKRKRPPRLPITVWLLARFLPFLNLALHEDATMWAALCVGVYGLLRAGEFCIKSQKSTPLLRSQVTWNDDHIVIHLLESKTDVFREGVDIRIYSNSSSTCPVAALRRCWLSAPRQSPGSPLFQDDTGAP